MTDAERTGSDHVVLPRRSPGLALLERYRPSPADNVLDAELAAFAAPGDTVLDPWAGTGWTARRAIAHEMRAVAADASPFGQLAAIAFLTAPDPAVLDAAFAQLGLPLAASTCRCGSTSRSSTRRAAPRAVGRSWSTSSSGRVTATRPAARSTAAPPATPRSGGRRSGWRRWTRSISPSSASRATLAPDRSPSTRRWPMTSRRRRSAYRRRSGERRRRRIGDGARDVIEVPARRRAARRDRRSTRAGSGRRSTQRSVRPRFASTVRPDPVPVARRGACAAARSTSSCGPASRCSMDATSSSRSCSSLYTPRNLYALHAIGAKIETEVRDGGTAAAHAPRARGVPPARQPAQRVPGPRRLAPDQRLATSASRRAATSAR